MLLVRIKISPTRSVGVFLFVFPFIIRFQVILRIGYFLRQKRINVFFPISVF